MRADRRGLMPCTPQIVVGLLIILWGLTLTADNLGWVNARHVLAYWPVGLLALGTVMFARASDASGRLSAGFVLAVGVLFTGRQVFGWHMTFGLIWPLFLVAVGGVLIARSVGLRPQLTAEAGDRRRVTGFAFWSGTKRRITSPVFERADFTAVMGGVEIDLRGAGTAGGEAVLDLFVVMGGIEIQVPPDWVVVNELVTVMGGVDDRSTGLGDAKHRLVLRGFALMGGVGVKT
jgi:predicted membrane protein